MNVIIRPAKLAGRIRAVSSKSDAHRRLILSALSDRPTDIFCDDISDDIAATMDSLNRMGANITFDGAEGVFHVEPVRLRSGSSPECKQINVRESGSTLRFLLPVIAALGLDARISMGGRLPERPLSPLWEELERHGAILSRHQDGSIGIGALGSGKLDFRGGLSGGKNEDVRVGEQSRGDCIKPPFRGGLLRGKNEDVRAGELSRGDCIKGDLLRGGLSGGEFRLRGDVSSQFVTGLLFALPLLDEPSWIRLLGPVESSGYIDMTLRAMRDFGVSVERDADLLSVVERCEDPSPLTAKTGMADGLRTPYLSPGRVVVEGDWSAAAFWEVAGLLSATKDASMHEAWGFGRIHAEWNICRETLREMTPAGGAFGNNEMLPMTPMITVEGLDESSAQGDRAVRSLKWLVSAGGAEIDAADIPDLVPVLAALASVSPGETVFTRASRLRLKESDRIKSTVDMILSLGGAARETSDGLVVCGVEHLRGGRVDSRGDHRIAMSAAVLSTACAGDVEITGAEAVGKSYPLFWEHFRALGGNIIEER